MWFMEWRNGGIKKDILIIPYYTNTLTNLSSQIACITIIFDRFICIILISVQSAECLHTRPLLFWKTHVKTIILLNPNVNYIIKKNNTGKKSNKKLYLFGDAIKQTHIIRLRNLTRRCEQWITKCTRVLAVKSTWVPMS